MDGDNASVLKLSRSLMTSDTYESTSNPPGSVRSFSVFGDSACGEPLLAQHLVIDFTPNEKVDTDFVQRKVCAFWEFVDDRPELRNLLVLPETDLFKVSDSSDRLPDIVKHKKKQNFDNKALKQERTAVSMLEFVEKKGLIDRTFESRLPQSVCSLGSRQYHETELPVYLDNDTLSETNQTGNCYQGQVKYSKRTQTTDFRRTKTDADVRNTCNNNEKCREQHAKCVQCSPHPHTTRQHKTRQKKTS